MKGRKRATTPTGEALRSVPAPPMWLPAEAKAAWRAAAKVLVSRRVLTDGDLAALEGYALHVGHVRLAAKAIEAEGAYVEGKRHPAFTTLTQSSAEARRLGAELGLSPTARNKLAAVAEEDDDELVE